MVVSYLEDYGSTCFFCLGGSERQGSHNGSAAVKGNFIGESVSFG